ncbi:MAG TPA: 3-phosphoshikimate 1-carboxyvinyltransferase [Candidatus Deferrimicrobium sp.]|nr:3-phosphoshikimate 1-carboxyvinyltransferase [Candidatus Deferrimicrobium sp.]
MWIAQKVVQLEGTITAPPSKSYTHRALVISALCPETSSIKNPLICYDTIRTIEGCRILGSWIEDTDPNELTITGFQHWRDAGEKNIDIGESGTTGRFLISLASLVHGTTILRGALFNRKRPFTSLIEALKKLGVEVDQSNEMADGFIKVKGKKNGEGYKNYTELIANGGSSYLKSSQYISSLLVTCPNYPNDIDLQVKATKIVSKPYIDVTLDLLNQVGAKIDKNKDYSKYHIQSNKLFRPNDYIIHGDYTQSAVFLALGALTDSNITIKDLIKSNKDKQGDKAFIDNLKKMGADIDQKEKEVKIKGPSELDNIEIDCIDTPDLVPIYAILGAFGKGTMELKDISHLQYKESNRGVVLQEELEKAGIDIKLGIDKNRLIIKHCDKIRESILNDNNDHRMGMAFTILALLTGKVKVNTSDDTIAKSYPKGRFLKDLCSVGAIIREK